MWKKTNHLSSFLFIPGLACSLFLISCTNSATTDDTTAQLTGAFAEDLGNGVCRELQSGLMWQIKESQKFSTWDEASEYVDSLQLGGFDDWRLPTRDECLSFAELLEIKRGTCPIKFRRSHWVSHRKKRKTGYWEDYPLCGGSEFRWVKGKEGSVRAVRNK